MSGPGSRAPPDAIRRSEDGRGVAERGAGDAEIARHEGRVRAHLTLDGSDERGHRGHDPPAQDEQLGIEKSDVVGDGRSQIPLGVVPDPARELVSRRGGAGHEGGRRPPGVAARVVLETGRRAVDERRLHTPHESLARGIGLDAAALTAHTGYAVRDDLGVTELARGIARSLEEQAVHHRARADSRANEDGDEALGYPPHPESVLTPGRRAHVVLYLSRQTGRG